MLTIDDKCQMSKKKKMFNHRTHTQIKKMQLFFYLFVVWKKKIWRLATKYVFLSLTIDQIIKMFWFWSTTEKKETKNLWKIFTHTPETMIISIYIQYCFIRINICELIIGYSHTPTWFHNRKIYCNIKCPLCVRRWCWFWKSVRIQMCVCFGYLNFFSRLRICC